MSRQLMEYNPAIGFRFIPGLKARVPHEGGGYLIRTNNEGFRCKHNFVKEKRAGIRRVLLFGNSYTAGDGVSNGKRYGDYLEKIIPNLEVYNFGMPATGTDQHYLIYKEFARKIKHDLMVIAVFVENIRRVNSHFRYFYDEKRDLVLYEKPYYSLRDGKLTIKNVPPSKKPTLEMRLTSEEKKYILPHARFPKLKKIFNKLEKSSKFRKEVIKSEFKDRILRWIHYQPLKEYNNPKNSAWLLMRAILEDWIINHKEPVILMPIPLYHHILKLSDSSHYNARLREVVSNTGCILHDPLHDLFTYPYRERRCFFFEQDGHLTPKGHFAFAKSLGLTMKKALNYGKNMENKYE